MAAQLRASIKEVPDVSEVTVLGGRPVVVKRLSAPADDDPTELRDPRHVAYWRRAADVVTARLGLESTPGLRAPRLTSVEEDDDGITLVQDWVEDAANSGLFCAVSLGRFAGAEHAIAAAADLTSNIDRQRCVTAFTLPQARLCRGDGGLALVENWQWNLHVRPGGGGPVGVLLKMSTHRQV